jgi:hypothetical protein
MLIISQDIQKRMSQRNTKRSLDFEVLTVTNRVDLELTNLDNTLREITFCA